MTKEVEELERVIIRFAGDSGDGMQLTGGRFTDATAVVGNDLATLPNFPAEIRAPAGTLAGVSAFQIHFASRDILTPGDHPNVLVAMNPAALKVNESELERGATIIVNEDAFTKRNLEKAGYEDNPLEDGSLSEYRVHRIPMSTLTTRAVEGMEGVSTRDASRAKNLFALGVVSWLYGRPTDVTKRWVERKFARNPAAAQANLAAFSAGWSFGETTELLDVQYHVSAATDVPPGTYRNVNGTTALSLGLIAASVRSKLPLVLASYPITPASEILHELSRHANIGVSTIQAEDEIAAVGMALGAVVRGPAGGDRDQRPRHGPQGRDDRPGGDARAPADHHRRAAGRALHRHADQDRAVRPADGALRPPRRVAAAGDRPEHRGWVLRRRVRGGADRHSLPDAGHPALRHLPGLVLGAVARARCGFAAGDRSELRHAPPERIGPAAAFEPYSRDDHLARPWAIPGTPGLQHRIGGLEKADITGNISYDGANHARMTELRAAKVAAIADEVPSLVVDIDPDPVRPTNLLVLGWGSTEGAIRAGVRRAREAGHKVACAQLRHLNPLPSNTGDVLRSFERVLVPELNSGQLAMLLRSRFLVDVESYTKIQGQPLFASEMEEEIAARQ